MVDQLIEAAGVCFYVDGRVLLVQRGPDGDHPGEWAFPGGHVEPGESPEQAARREAFEEVGLWYQGTLFPVAVTEENGVRFHTFMAYPTPFIVVLNDESTNFIWAPAREVARLRIKATIIDETAHPMTAERA